MRVAFAGLVAIVCLTVVLALTSSSALAKTCSAGYIHGVIHGAQKCLRRGEYCTHAFGNAYHRYGFNCVLVNGTYRLEPR
jgi:hypothetical protein